MAKQFLRTDNVAKRILSVKFVRHMDEYPDLSYLGEYSDRAGPNAIVRGACRGEFRYFNPAMSGEETGNPDSPRQDYERAEAYNDGQWHMTFCQAIAEVSIGGVNQRITSGGIGGVESDSDASHFAELATEELNDLAGILRQMGFPARVVKAAIKAADID